MISDVEAGVTVVILTVLCLAFFVVIGIMEKFIKMVEEEELQKAVRDINSSRNLQQEGFASMLLAGNDFITLKYLKILKQMRQCLFGIYLDQAIKGAAFSLVLWIILTSWFIYHDTYLLSFGAFLWGIISVCAAMFIIVHFSVPAISRFVVQSNYGAGHGFVNGWLSSVAISSSIVALVLLFYMFFEPACKFIYMVPSDGKSWWDGDFKKWLDQNFGPAPGVDQDHQVKHLYYAILSYGMAVITTGIFLRDCPKIIGAGLVVGYDIASKLAKQHDESENITLTLKKAKIVGGVLSDLQVAADAICFTSAILVVLPLLTAHTSLSAFYQYSPFYYPLYMIGVGSLVSCVASALVLLQRKYTPENDPAVDGVEPVAKPGIKAFTAKQVRLQLLIVNSYTAGVLFAISLICLPDTTFNIGDDVLSPFYFENATVGTAIWCLEIGLLTQTVKLVLAEYFTSHRFQPIRSVAGDTRQDVTLGFIQLTSSSHVGHFFLMLTLGVSIMLCYVLGGFYGIAMGALGMTCNYVILLTCMIFGQMCIRAEQLMNYANEFSYVVMARISTMGYAARNYRIFLPIVNCGGVFMLNMVCIGLINEISAIEDVVIWDAFTIYGFIVGSGLAYFLNGNSVLGVKNIIDIEDEHTLDSNEKEDDVFQGADPWRFIKPKINIAFFRVLINVSICAGTIIFIASIFGGSGLIGYVLGLNLIGLHLTYLSILKYYGAQNTHNYNLEANSQDDQTLIHTDEQGQERIRIAQLKDKGSIQLEVAHTVLDSNALIIYLLFNMLFVLHGVRVMASWGKVGQVFKKDIKEVSKESVEAVVTGIEAVEDKVQSKETADERHAEEQKEIAIAANKKATDGRNKLERIQKRVQDRQNQAKNIENEITEAQKAATTATTAESTDEQAAVTDAQAEAAVEAQASEAAAQLLMFFF